MTEPRRVLVPFGTRPEIVKLAPVVRTLVSSGFAVRTVATGQHHDAAMAGAFFDELGLEPAVRYSLDGDEPRRLGALTEQAERELADHPPHVVLLLGDTNTVPAYCLAARRRRIPVAHLEAGLRSFNQTSMEEVNRKVAAASATLQLAPTELARRFLLDEGVNEELIEVVGNPVIDVLVESGARPLPVADREGVLVTAHRATNVDDPERLADIVTLIADLARSVGRVVFPVHPRTMDRLESSGLVGRLRHEDIELYPPLPYSEMLALLASSRLVVTDSGGVQEEASYFGVPVVVLRRSTPRWEGVALGSARLVGHDVATALAAASAFCEPEEQARIAAIPCPYGDGRTSERVRDLLGDAAVIEQMRLREPDLTGGLAAAAGLGTVTA
jgi:UDP-N-acetylglucosamine 2-epimerase (non-hydrolysing)